MSIARLAWIQGALVLMAAAVAAIAIVAPHSAPIDVEPALAVQTAAAIWGLVLLTAPRILPAGAVRHGPWLAVAPVTATAVLSGDIASAFALLYIFAALHAFQLATPRRVAAYFGWIAINYAAAGLITSTPGVGWRAELEQGVLVVGAVAATCAVAAYLRIGVDQLMERLTDAARTDDLTGLLGRAAGLDLLESALGSARITGEPVCVVAADLDRFKALNERCGSATGDDVLRRVAGLIADSTPAGATVARTGAEDFLVILPGLDERHAFLFAAELLDRVRSDFGDLPIRLTGSAGVAAFPEHGDRLEDLLASLDQALFAAKALGGDRPVAFSPEVTGAIGRHSGRRSVETQAQLATVLSLAEALDHRDAGTALHSQTVGRMCELMARELGFDGTRIERVRLAGILHDIGKIGVPDAILGKPGPLNSAEAQQMRRHPDIGARILSSRELEDLRTWIRAHHERPDGRGYPEGMKAPEIPLEASVLAVGDAYEAMTSDRVYRRSLGPERARRELLNGVGTQFDGRVVGALLRVLEHERIGAPGS